MLDAALIEKCADPSLTSAIVEQFVQAAGAPDPLAITVKSGGRLVLVPKPKTPEEALEIIREHAGRAVVRVGLTQFPAGVGVKDASELKTDLVDACENLRMGTKMFAKIMRIVAKWYGNPTSREVLPQIFEDAIYSWKTGEFEGVGVFQVEDPGETRAMPKVTTTGGEPNDESRDSADDKKHDADIETDEPIPTKEPSLETDAEKAGIRIDMSRIGGRK